MRGKFAVGDPSRVRGMTLSAEYRGGIVVYLNGREVARGTFPKGKGDMLELAEDYPLDAFVAADVPMLLEERSARIQHLRDTMNRADVADSEKYRAIMEAYQIENEYGRTIETYHDDIELGGEIRTLDFLRIGRVALLYRTLDGSQSGAWNQRARNWIELPSEYRAAIRKGIRVARKQAAPDFIRLPILAPEKAN